MVGWLLEVYIVATSKITSRGGRMSRAPASHFGRSGNPKIAGSSPEPVGSKPDRVKPMTLKLILVASYPDTQHY